MTGFDGLAPCVHCGFCLQQCPTYLVTGDEADSPRGRIVLMQRLASHAMGPDDEALQYHLDRCLGCRACEPVCPSGVAYGPAIEAARARIAAVRAIPLIARLMLALMARPALRRVVFAFARVVRHEITPHRIEPFKRESLAGKCGWKEGGEEWWTAGGSNSRPPRCERGALPTELAAHSTNLQFTMQIQGPATRGRLCYSPPNGIDRAVEYDFWKRFADFVFRCKPCPIDGLPATFLCHLSGGFDPKISINNRIDNAHGH